MMTSCVNQGNDNDLIFHQELVDKMRTPPTGLEDVLPNADSERLASYQWKILLEFNQAPGLTNGYTYTKNLTWHCLNPKSWLKGSFICVITDV